MNERRKKSYVVKFRRCGRDHQGTGAFFQGKGEERSDGIGTEALETGREKGKGKT